MTAQPPGSDNQNPQSEPPAFGWKPYAERINSRFAMIGFAALLILEFSTGQDFFSWIGLR
ncbi:chlorophyll a/b-binding protein [Phormidesmis priestleyi]